MVVRSCESSGLKEETCECVYKILSSKYDMSSMKALEIDLESVSRQREYISDTLNANLICIRKHEG